MLELGKPLQALMGGRHHCLEEELTRDVLMRFAQLNGDIRWVELIDVEVQVLLTLSLIRAIH